jgi:hypothetical protein
MSERKTIQINPELFKVSNVSRKKKPADHPKIQMKNTIKSQKQKTLRKNVLKMIREKQQESYRELFDTKKKPTKEADAPYEKEFNKDFDETVEFFSSLSSKIEERPKPSAVVPHNITFKNRTSSVLSHEDPPILEDPFPNEHHANVDTEPYVEPFTTLDTPKYGCLKNGTLPTWRNYTRKNGSNPVRVPPPPPSHLLQNTEIIQKMEKIHGVKPEKQKRIKYLKRKKIFKRTYHVGRNKSVVGVLISNKTIRNRVTTQSQLLKQTPIKDVRRFLIKKGLIKVGTNTPNDVLRKMYETVSLLCGEIQNHNPENLLYNFIHDTTE